MPTLLHNPADSGAVARLLYEAWLITGINPGEHLFPEECSNVRRGTIIVMTPPASPAFGVLLWREPSDEVQQLLRIISHSIGETQGAECGSTRSGEER